METKLPVTLPICAIARPSPAASTACAADPSGPGELCGVAGGAGALARRGAEGATADKAEVVGSISGSFWQEMSLAVV